MAVKRAANPYIAVTEAEWRQTVIDIAHTYHWKVFCNRVSAYVGKRGKAVSTVMGDSVGWPDIFCARDGLTVLDSVYWFELKDEKTMPTPAQAEWLILLNRIFPGRALLLRPHDVDAVQRLLK